MHKGQETHSYPFCERSGTPLIFRALPAWFIKVENIREDLVECNSKTRWVPDFVKEKRFKNWLLEAKDWCVSRNRFWGTPLPLWVSDFEEVVCIGSVSELEEVTNSLTFTDILVDDIQIPSKAREC